MHFNLLILIDSNKVEEPDRSPIRHQRINYKPWILLRFLSCVLMNEQIIKEMYPIIIIQSPARWKPLEAEPLS